VYHSKETQKRPLSLKKRPTTENVHHSKRDPQKRPTKETHITQKRHTEETYITQKETYIPQKETYITQKETYMTQKNYRDRVGQQQARAACE